MKNAIDPVRLSRRGLLGSFGVGAALGIGAWSTPARAETEEVLTEALVLRDPDIPVAGNAVRRHLDHRIFRLCNVRIAARSIRNCSQVVHDDGKVRMVWKDWPILGPMSVTAARMAQASKIPGQIHRGTRRADRHQFEADGSEDSRGACGRRRRHGPARPRSRKPSRATSTRR